MSQFIYPPSAAAGSNPSVSANGDPIPASSTLIAAENPSGDLQPLQTNAAGDLLVEINSETSGLATSTNQTTQITEAQSTNTKLDTLNAKDFATQTTLAALNAKVTAVNTGAVVVSSSALPTGAATESTLDSIRTDVSDLHARISGAMAPPDVFDELNITYVAAGNGVGEIETVEYSNGGTPVGTLTLSYDAQNRLTSVIRS